MKGMKGMKGMKHTYMKEYPLTVSAYNNYRLIAKHTWYSLTILKANIY